jgi:hypothetical protein
MRSLGYADLVKGVIGVGLHAEFVKDSNDAKGAPRRLAPVRMRRVLVVDMVSLVYYRIGGARDVEMQIAL